MKLCKIMVFLLLFFTVVPVFAENAAPIPSGGVISGQVMINAKSPMANGVVLLYSDYTGPPPNPYKYWRIPDKVITTDDQGRFSLNLDEGTFFLMAIQKKPNGEIGPPLNSKYYYLHADAKGNPKPITVNKGVSVNLGRLLSSLFLSPANSELEKEITSIEGIVLDSNGKPVENVLVLSFYNSEARMRPAFVSERTDKKGRFVIRVAEGGNYWLKVRGAIGGGMPKSGEYVNTTEEFVPLMVSVDNGQKLTGVVLNVKAFDGGIPPEKLNQQ